MSIIFLVIFISLLKGIVDPSEINAEFFYYWALFAIGDALWFDLLFGNGRLLVSGLVSMKNAVMCISTGSSTGTEWKVVQ